MICDYSFFKWESVLVEWMNPSCAQLAKKLVADSNDDGNWPLFLKANINDLQLQHNMAYDMKRKAMQSCK
jgi:hypothetical protein